jgi:MFS transporter, PAT family, beta-lactamase induction signal transducer AmpG
MQGAMAGAISSAIGLRSMVGSAGALWIAGAWAGRCSYGAMAALAHGGIITTLCVGNEPQRVRHRLSCAERRVVDWLERRRHWPPSLQAAGAWLLGAVICP